MSDDVMVEIAQHKRRALDDTAQGLGARESIIALARIAREQHERAEHAIGEFKDRSDALRERAERAEMFTKGAEYNEGCMRADLDAATADNARLREALINSDAWRAPCPVCGYKGPGWYQPATHPCAALRGRRE